MKFCDKRIQNHLLNGGKIKRVDSNCIIYLNDNCELYCESSYADLYFLVKKDLTSNDWEIVESEYDWDKIIEDKILCEFSDDGDFKDDEKVISILTSIDEYRGFYYNSQGFRYKYCKAFNQSEYINVDEDLKEYKK